MLMGNKVKVAIDTNVLLDVLLETRPGHHLAQQVISAAEASTSATPGSQAWPPRIISLRLQKSPKTYRMQNI